MLKKEMGIKSCKNNSTLKTISRDWKMNRALYIMIIPILVFYILFHYVPMYGAVIAFKSFSPRLGILGSPWVGLKHFKDFFTGFYFKTLLTNTLRISITGLIFGFPFPIILAILVNELRSKTFAKITQTVSYLPHFISTVVVCGMITNFVDHDGIISSILAIFGKERTNLLYDENLFTTIYNVSGIWQNTGFSSIVFFAALMGIDEELYEAAELDGAGRFKKIWYITLPGIIPTIITILILSIGSIMNVGFEKIILLYTGLNAGKADVISSYVYRQGLQNFNWSYSSAVGLFNTIINFTLLMITNAISKKYAEIALW